MILVVFVDWHYREKPRPHKSGYFYGAFIAIFSHESAFRLVFRPHETSESSHRNIRMILQQNGSVSWRRESERKGLNTTFRCSTCFSAISQARGVVVIWRSRFIARKISLLSFWNRSPSARIQVKGYTVSKISLDSFKGGLKQFKVAFAGSSLRNVLVNHARSFFHLIQKFMASIFVHLQSKFYK